MDSKFSTRPITLQTAPQAAAQAIREAIISGELVGGDRILEQHWATRLGIGQPTLREATRELVNQGLLRKETQRGTYVAELSPDDYRQILETRIPLEAIAIGLAAQRLTPAVKKELTDVIAVMKETQSDKDVDVRRFHDCDVLFHRRIWETAGNPYLRELLETITFRLFVFSVVGRWPNKPNAAAERKAAVDQHVGILKGILTGDPARARKAFVDCTIKYWDQQYGLGLRSNEVLQQIV